MKEEWRKVVEWEEYYEVSNKGRIKSLARIRNSIMGQIPMKEKIRKLYHHPHGYMYVSLCKNNKSKYYKVHRLVAKAFIPNPENKRTVNHKNGIKNDNRVENLEWATHSENAIHAFKTKLRFPTYAMKGKTGKDNVNSKSVTQYDKQMNPIAEYGSIHEASRMSGATATEICEACRNEILTAKGFVWRYTLNNTTPPYRDFRKAVFQYDMNMEFIARYSSAKEAQKVTGIRAGNINGVCNTRNGRTHTCGYIWKYT